MFAYIYILDNKLIIFKSRLLKLDLLLNNDSL